MPKWCSTTWIRPRSARLGFPQAGPVDWCCCGVVVHPYGLPMDLVETRRLAEAGGAVVIEDAAQAVCVTVEGRPAGSIGAFGVLSFGRGKGLTGAPVAHSC